MTTMTQLFKIVSANDYDTLQKLIMGNKKPDFNCIKSGSSLVTKSIEVRATECFNLLLSLNDLSILQSNNSHINGLNIAIDYYSTAPNSINKYFLDKLIEKNVTTDLQSLCKCMDDPMLFENMFNRIDKSSINMSNLINYSVRKTKIDIMTKLYDYLHNNNPPYFDTTDKKNNFNDDILKAAISTGNIVAIEYLEQISHNIMCIKHNNSQVIPSLYYCLITSCDPVTFNYIFSQMEKLDETMLNNIQSIKKLNILITNTSYYSQVKNYVECFKKILSLPINFVDLHETVTNLYSIIYKSNTYYYSYNRFICQIKDQQYLMYILLKTNYVKINPYIQLVQYKYDINNVIINAAKHLSPEKLNEYKSFFRKNKYMLNHFGFVETESLADHFRLIFTEKDKLRYEVEKKEFLDQIENQYNNVVEDKKTKPKKPKKKQCQNDIVV